MSKFKITKWNIAEASEDYSKKFGANKNLYRIIPSLQDGFKPVNRRALYSLWKGKGRHKFIKLAKAASDTLDYHPHSSASVEDVIARMANGQINNICPVEGQGHFGSYKSEEAAAARYIEVKLSKYALKCFFEDFENSNVDMKIAYTGDDYEPEVLPARYPHALFNPQLSGIGYAMASNIPPFNISEVLHATIKLIKNKNANILLVPDSPTGADVIDDGQFETINKEGIGTFTLRGHVDIDPINNILTITSIPLQITIDAIIKNIVEMKLKGQFNEIKEIKDYTNNEKGVKTLIYLDPTANPLETIEKLYKKGTGLKKTYPVGIKMIDDYKDYDFGVKSFLLEWIDYRRDTVRSSYNTQLVKTMEEDNINEVLLLILNKDNAEKTIKLAKNSKNKAEFASSLMKLYDINSQQADTVANMKIYAFSKDAYADYKRRKVELKEEIKRIENILDNDSEIDKIIISQLEEGIKLFGSPRKSDIVKLEEVEDVPDTEHIIGISLDGYIKKIDIGDNIGEVGKNNKGTLAIQANNKKSILIFDSTGIVSKIRVSDIPNMDKNDNGILLDRYFNIKGEPISVLVIPENKESKEICFITITKNGFVKKVMLSEFLNINGSMTAVKLNNDDTLIAVEITKIDTHYDAIIYTNKGMGIRRDINEFTVMKPNSKGTRQIKLDEDEYVVGISKIDPEYNHLVFVTAKGNLKITETKYLPSMKRKEDSIKLTNLDNKDNLVGISSVSLDNSITVYRKHSKPITFDINSIPILTRIAKAVKMVKVNKGDYIINYIINKKG